MLCLHHPKSKSSKPLLSPRTRTTTTDSAPRTGPSHPPTPSPSPSPSPLLSPKIEPTSTSTTPDPGAAANKVEIHRLLGRERERERDRDSDNAEETTQPPPGENPNNPALTTPSVTSTNTSTPPNPHPSTAHHHEYDSSTSPLPPSHAVPAATSPSATPISTSIPPSLRSSESSVPTATTTTTSARSTPTSAFAPQQSQLHSQPLQHTSTIPSKRPAPPPSPATASAPVGGGPGPSSSLSVGPGSHDPHHVSPPPAKKQSKWSPEEDQLIIRLRGDGMKWEDISKHLPGRSAISCRLHYQNYLERRSEWDEERRNKLARLYERFKPEMWSRVAEELSIPWRAAEAMHWQLGEAEMARRAGVVPFTLASSATAPLSSTSTAGPLSSTITPSSAHAAIRGHARSRSTGTRHLNLSGATYGTPPPPPPPAAMEPERTLPSVAELTRGVPAWDLRGEGMAMDPRGPLSAHGYPGESMYGAGPQGPAYLRRSPERGPPPGSAHGRGGYGHGPPGPPGPSPGSGRRF